MSALATAERLMTEGRLDAALAITAPMAASATPDLAALAVHSSILKALGRREEALDADRRALALAPNSGVAWHNLGATLADLGRGSEAVEALLKAIGLGTNGALTWGALARAEVAAGDLDAAEAAYGETLRRAPQRPDYAEELADLVWMRRGALDEAQVVLDRTFHAGGHPSPLLVAKARLFEASGDADRAADLLAAAADRMPDDVKVQLACAEAEVGRGRLAEALRRVDAANAVVPDFPSILIHYALVYLAQGRAGEALAKIRLGLKRLPDDQALLSWAATAARAAGDPLYAELADYPRVVAGYDIAAPPGWSDLGAYLADLAATLERLHGLQEHPSGQSLRHGTQLMYRLTGSSEPTLKAFFQVIDGPIRQHLARLGRGSDAVGRRNTGEYRIEGAWSVRLRPGGYHRDHYHSEGWLSSAFYVETPKAALETPEREGWIRFGRPPSPVSPPMAADHYERPQPGRLVLFPSYMWHGTVPFHTDERRMTIAFDVVPA